MKKDKITNIFNVETDWKFLKEQLIKIGFKEKTKNRLIKDGVLFKLVENGLSIVLYDNKTDVLMSVFSPLGSTDDLQIIEKII